MDLLQFLALHQGEVVSQQQIADAIWPNTTFSPTSVQRSIAVLRKALLDDAKNPHFILTHPKRGYCLAVDVQNLDKSAALTAPKIGWVVAVISLVIMIYSTANLLLSTRQTNRFSTLTPITASEQNEFSVRYSPDGEYIVFIRQVSERQSNIWLKHLESGTEQRLSRESSHYTSVSWQASGRGLVLVESKPTADVVLYLGFEPLVTQPILGQKILELPEQKIQGQLQYTRNDELLFASKAEAKSSTLSLFHPASQISKPLFQFADNTRVSALALAPDQKTVAVAQKDVGGSVTLVLIDLLTKTGQTLTSISADVHGLNWHPDGNTLLVASKAQLLTVDLNGKVTSLEFSNYLNIAGAQYHPDGAKIALTLVGLDVDIVTQPLGKSAIAQKTLNTRAADIQPVYAPNGRHFAFQSLRGGSMQLLLRQNGVDRLLFDNGQKQELYGFTWSPDGKTIALATLGKLHFIDVQTTSTHSVAVDLSNFYLRDWFQNDNALLINLKNNDALFPAKLNLEDLTVTVLSETSGSCAALDNQDNLYLNHGSKITKLTKQGLISTWWQPPDGRIEMFAIAQDRVMVEVSQGQNHSSLSQMWQVGLSPSVIEQAIGDTRGRSFVDVSDNAQNLLFHSPVVRTKTIVVLQ